MIIGSKNKGDWSELYVLLFLLGSGRLYYADERLNKIKNIWLPIKKIFRNDIPERNIDFILKEIDRVGKVKIFLNSELLRVMPSREFEKEARELYRDMLDGSGSFNISHAENFLNKIGLERLSAPPSDITDIKMEVHDTNTGIDQVMGFSIKSYIGGAPTLLNASGATNFIYEVMGISDEQMVQINSIKTRTKIMDRINAIFEYGGKMKFCNVANRVFASNLIMIDSRMEEILAEALLYSYVNNNLDCKEIIWHLEEKNPLKYPRTGAYIYKFKQFLCAKALGMEPSSRWTGEDQANGGYIVAKFNGDVLAYHLYNRDKFKEYLFDNTRLERGSTSRHRYAEIYKKASGKMYINLNLQIRFKDRGDEETKPLHYNEPASNDFEVAAENIAWKN